MRRLWLVALGLLTMAVGVLIVVGPTFGFTSVAADRGVGVGVAENDTAYLGIENETDIGVIRGDSGPQRVGTLFNNFDQDVDVVDVRLHNDGGVLAVNAPQRGTTIPADGNRDVTIECAAGENLGVREVEVEIVEVAGSTVAVKHASFTVTVDIQCKKGGGSGSVNFRAGDVRPGDTSQTFSFSEAGLGNGDEAYIDLSGPENDGGVNYPDDPDAVTVTSDNKGSAEYDPETNRITYTAHSDKSTVELRIDGIEVTGDIGDRYTVTYSEQRKNSNNRDDSDVFYVTE